MGEGLETAWEAFVRSLGCAVKRRLALQQTAEIRRQHLLHTNMGEKRYKTILPEGLAACTRISDLSIREDVA